MASLVAAEEGVEIGEVAVGVYKIMAAWPRRLPRLDLAVGPPPGMPVTAARAVDARIRDTTVARSLPPHVEIRVDVVESGAYPRWCRLGGQTQH